MKLAVVIPSRLQPNPMSTARALYLHRAIESVRRQTATVDHDVDIVVGIDRDAPVPPDDLFGAARFTKSEGAGQALALNAAAKITSSDLLAFLEDDDTWEPRKLEYQIEGIKAGFNLVTSNQRETRPDGTFVRINDFATPSGWLMTRETWEAVGPFDPSFRWHLDNEWFGRFNERGRCSSWSRMHLVEAGADQEPRRDWLRNVMQSSKAGTTAEDRPLVNRTVNPGGGMARIETDPVARAESLDEHRRLIARFGGVPW